MKSFLLDSLDLLFDPRAKALIKDAFAYGSATFNQKGNIPSMFDLMISVSNTNLFHKYQLESFPCHYAPWAAHRIVSFLNDSSPNLYYNTGIRANGEVFKYGVIQSNNLSADLTEWKNLYAAGRLQKPLLILIESEKTQKNNFINRTMSLKLASLINNINCQSPSNQEWASILKSIVELSYNGDVRMFIAENPLKIQKILESQFDSLLEIYKPLYPFIEKVDFPPLLKKNNLGELLKACRYKVFKSSIAQSIKGLVTAKPMTAFNYVTRKIKKKFIQ